MFFTLRLPSADLKCLGQEGNSELLLLAAAVFVVVLVVARPICLPVSSFSIASRVAQ